MKKQPKVLVLSGYGLNCEEETKFAFELAGAIADIIHINDLIDTPKRLRRYHILAFPGGFAYGDDTGSGNAYGWKVRNHLWDEIAGFVTEDRLVIGICNGFQILVALGLLPALDNKYGDRQVALLHNSTARYTVRWTDVFSDSKSPWLRGMKDLSLPIAHGEGRIYASDEVLDVLEDKKMIALRYVKGPISRLQKLPANPTGTLRDIAGITNENGRIFGTMPHPERAVLFTQLPDWPYQKEKLLREGKKLPQFGPGIKIFRNAVEYFIA